MNESDEYLKLRGEALANSRAPKLPTGDLTRYCYQEPPMIRPDGRYYSQEVNPPSMASRSRQGSEATRGRPKGSGHDKSSDKARIAQLPHGRGSTVRQCAEIWRLNESTARKIVARMADKGLLRPSLARASPNSPTTWWRAEEHHLSPEPQPQPEGPPKQKLSKAEYLAKIAGDGKTASRARMESIFGADEVLNTLELTARLGILKSSALVMIALWRSYGFVAEDSVTPGTRVKRWRKSI